jgi:hypothetical protein
MHLLIAGFATSPEPRSQVIIVSELSAEEARRARTASTRNGA